jgi:arylsulfatase A-like enzyme
MPYEPPVIEPDRPTLPKMLKRAGYATACIGKWHLGFRYPARAAEGASSRRGRQAGEGDVVYTQSEDDIDFAGRLDGGPVDTGFDYFFGTAGCSTSDPPYCFIENARTVSIPKVKSTEDLHKLPGFYPGLMAADWVEEDVDYVHLKKAVEFVDRHREQRPHDPFFLHLAISAPHNPWLPPSDLQGKSREGARGDMNVLVDWCVGEMYRVLSERGILDETLLIFTSDNGPMRGEGEQQSAGPLRGYKNTAFEGGHRVPFVARWPAEVPAGAACDEVLCLTDLYRTFVELTGVSPEPDAAEDSFSVLELLRGNIPETPARPTLVSDTGGFASTEGDFAVRWGPWKLVVLAEPDKDPMARRKVPIEDAVENRLLFHLETDRSESTNLIQREPEIAAALERLLGAIKERGSRAVDAAAIMGGAVGRRESGPVKAE